MLLATSNLNTSPSAPRLTHDGPARRPALTPGVYNLRHFVGKSLFMSQCKQKNPSSYSKKRCFCLKRAGNRSGGAKKILCYTGRKKNPVA